MMTNEGVSLLVVLVYIYLTDMPVVEGKVEQRRAIFLSFLGRQHEKHLHHFVAQSHKRNYPPFTDDIKIHRLQVNIFQARAIKLNVFLRKEMV